MYSIKQTEAAVHYIEEQLGSMAPTPRELLVKALVTSRGLGNKDKEFAGSIYLPFPENGRSLDMWLLHNGDIISRSDGQTFERVFSSNPLSPQNYALVDADKFEAPVYHYRHRGLEVCFDSLGGIHTVNGGETLRTLTRPQKKYLYLDERDFTIYAPSINSIRDIDPFVGKDVKRYIRHSRLSSCRIRFPSLRGSSDVVDIDVEEGDIGYKKKRIAAKWFSFTSPPIMIGEPVSVKTYLLSTKPILPTPDGVRDLDGIYRLAVSKTHTASTLSINQGMLRPGERVAIAILPKPKIGKRMERAPFIIRDIRNWQVLLQSQHR